MSSVDVFVPCYRYGHYLRECVDSILKQEGTNVRVLILDDASPDNTAEVGEQLAGEDARVTFRRHTGNKGHIATYNEGLEWASADYLLLLSADDYLLPGALRRAADLMDAHGDVGFTFGSGIELENGESTHQMVEAGSSLGEGDRRVLSGRAFIDLSGPRNIVCTPTAVVRTEVQKRLGGYRPELPHTGDMEMWLRIAAHASVGIIGAYQAVYRRHAANMSLDYTTHKLRDIQERKAAVDYFVRTCSQVLPNSELLHRRMSQALAREAIGCASAAFNERDMNRVEEAVRFAVGTCPEVTRSLPWAKFALKRSLGTTRWFALQPAVEWIRQVVPFRRDR